jgi:hypothetical protein
MPRPYQPKTDRKNQSHRHQVLPLKFKSGFLAELDKRTDLAKALRANFNAVVEDVGGPQDVGHVKSALVERFVWLEAILQTLEHEMASGKIDKSEALGRWIQAVNALSGLAKVLGVERRTRSMPWLIPIPPNGENGGENGKAAPPSSSGEKNGKAEQTAEQTEVNGLQKGEHTEEAVDDNPTDIRQVCP